MSSVYNHGEASNEIGDHLRPMEFRSFDLYFLIIDVRVCVIRRELGRGL